MTKKKIAIAAVLVCILALGVAAVTWAADPAPTVIFDAKAKTFTFQNCIQYTYGDEDGDGIAEQYPDLFPAIKNAMPGDSFAQNIRARLSTPAGMWSKCISGQKNPMMIITS